MPDKYDPDERFSLHPMEGEEVIKKLLDPKKEPDEVTRRELLNATQDPELPEDDD